MSELDRKLQIAAAREQVALDRLWAATRALRHKVRRAADLGDLENLSEEDLLFLVRVVNCELQSRQQSLRVDGMRALVREELGG